MLSWEKPLVKPMAPGSIFHHISFQSILFCNLYFPIYIIKIPKIFILLSLSDVTFASGHEGIDNPFIVLVARFLFFCACTRDLSLASYYIDTLVLENWGKYLRYFAASPFPLQGKTNACSRGSKKDFWRHCRGGLRQVKSRFDLPKTSHFWRRCRGVYAQVKTYQVPITNYYPSHYIICHLPLVFLSPTSPLPFLRTPSVRPCVTMCLLFACIFAC